MSKKEKKSIFGKIISVFTTPIGGKKGRKNPTTKRDNRINLEVNEEESLEKRVPWAYVARNSRGKKIRGYFYAFNKKDVEYFLESEDLEVVSVKTSKSIQLLNYGFRRDKKLKTKYLVFMLTELATYIKAGISLSEALGIMARETKNMRFKNILREMRYDINSGDSFSKALMNRGSAFPTILINMVKTAEMTGSLSEALDDMSKYFGDIEETRRQMISILTYPTIIFTFAIAVIMFIMVYVIPKFVDIYATMENTKIPHFTKTVMGISKFFQNNLIVILLIVIILLATFILLYRKVKSFRMFFQKIGMRLPFIGNIMIYNEVTIFSKTFSTLLRHDVFITDTMQILKELTNNEIYHEMIDETIENIKKGEEISIAFKDHWAFPLPAYEMIVTGEKTGKLADMMEQVSDYYSSLHRSAILRLKSLIEPLIIALLAVMVGAIILSVIVPMFSMYESVQNLG